MIACQFCGRDINWYRTVQGNMMPVNPEPSQRGTIMLIGMPPVATVLTKTELELRRNPNGTRLFVSHWDTCPSAQQARVSRDQMSFDV